MFSQVLVPSRRAVQSSLQSTRWIGCETRAEHPIGVPRKDGFLPAWLHKDRRHDDHRAESAPGASGRVTGLRFPRPALAS